MAAIESKRSVRKKQSEVRSQKSGNPESKANQKTKQHTKPRNKLSPGELALQEKRLPHTRFVDFPQVVGKTIERFHFYTDTDYHCITLDLQDKTALNLEIEPGCIIKAQLQQIRKGEINIVAEWAGLSSQGNSG